MAEMTEVKVTNKMVLEAILSAIAGGVEIEVGEVSTADVKAYAEKTIEQINAKNEKAKERAAQKRAESDELRAAVKAVLTDEYQTGEQILAQIEGEDLTKSKIIARLTDLIKHDEAIKDYVKDEEGRKVMGYKAV